MILLFCFFLSACGTQFSTIFINEDEADISQRTKQAILLSQATLQQYPEDVKTAFALAAHYLQAARESADTAYYDRVEKLLTHVDDVQPENPETLYLRGQILMGRHDFARALPFGQKLTADYPQVVRYYGLLTDAQIELGMYPEAIATLQTMADLRPDNAVLTRIAYVREIHGDFPGAIEAMQQVVDAPYGIAEQDAWSLSELARLLLPTDLAMAKLRYTQALTIYPDSAPALAGLAKIAAFENDFTTAEKQAMAAFEKLGLPEYSTLLGDIHAAQGKTDKAEFYYILSEAGYDAVAKTGTDVDLERAQFLADHNRTLPLALELAKKVYAARATIYTADLLSHASLLNGQKEDAWTYAQEALKTNSKDPMILTHAALAAEAVGEKVKAGDLKKEAAKRPNFSLIPVK